MFSRAACVPLWVAALLATGCDHRLPLAPQGVHHALNSAGTARVTVAAPRHVEGVVGPGALYALDVPEQWNGELVVYAHGYTEESGAPVALPNIGYFRDPVLARGYAFATTSFSSNGYALKEGVLQTHQLSGLFASRFGPPRRTLVVGQSLGGIIALKLAETYPEQYAGALLGCGVLGGTRDEITFIANVRVLFDFFYPNVLPGSLLEVPPGVNFQTEVAPKIVQAISANPTGAALMARILAIPFTSGPQLVEAIVRELGFQFLGADDFLSRAHGHVFFDNSNTVYTGAGVPQAVLDDLNARVARYQSTPDAESFLSAYYQPRGNLKNPVVALHTRWDPIVPLFNEDLYEGIVDQAGHSDLLRQRVVNRFGHCTYTPDELLASFDELTAWVASREPVPVP